MDFRAVQASRLLKIGSMRFAWEPTLSMVATFVPSDSVSTL